ncbi:hypothetical protein HanHA89_Chr04g0141161 [Helianthus annuus]|nr:hypothetical protein HanHA89_Chr04g0141161 [Helianthus annuus]
MSFLQQSRSSFRESHLPVDLILDPLQRYLSPTHFRFRWWLLWRRCDFIEFSGGRRKEQYSFFPS